MVSNLEVITTALKANPSAFQSLSLKLKEKEWQKFTDSPTEEELVYLVTNRIKLNASQFEEFLAMVNDIEGLDLLAKRLTAGEKESDCLYAVVIKKTSVFTQSNTLVLCISCCTYIGV